MATNFKGIDTVNLERLIAEIPANANEVYNAFKKLDTIIEQYNDCFLDDIGIPYKKKYELYSSNYYTIYENLTSIGDEFIRVSSRYDAKDAELKTTYRVWFSSSCHGVI